MKWGFIAAVWAAVMGGMGLVYFGYDLPDVDKLYEDKRTPNIRILDRNGETIAMVGDLYGTHVTFKQLPKHLVNAVVATEDRRFFSHFGIDPIGMARAAFRNWRAGSVVQGGSTITQQLAKVVFLSPERKLKRKIQEMMLAFYLERKFTKEEILAMYLNRIYLGSGNYGVDAASKSYFGKPVQDINLFESATLAGLIKAPSRYSPAKNYELSQGRADQVLRLMIENGMLTEDDIIKGGVSVNYKVARPNVPSRYPYFVDWVKEQLPEYVGNEKGEILVYTTLDPKIQNLAQEALITRLKVEGGSHKVSQGAMVVLSPTGEVRALIGGKSYGESQFNRATQALRQPGSAFKMFVYLAALEQGFSPDVVMVDEPVSIRKWKPKNWDGKYIGAVSLKDALAKSINTIAVKLAQQVGMKKVILMAQTLGITSDINNDLSSALGSSEVTLLELTGAYAHLANDGNAVWVHGITKIETAEGTLLYQRKPSGKHRVVSARAVDGVDNMLRGVVEYGTGKRAQLPYRAAGKTGTSQDGRDGWFIGYTSGYVAGVWLGNDDNSPMKGISGGGMPAQIWKDFMLAAGKGNSGWSPFNGSSGSQGGKKGKSLWDNIVNTFGGKATIEHDYPAPDKSR